MQLAIDVQEFNGLLVPWARNRLEYIMLLLFFPAILLFLPIIPKIILDKNQPSTYL